MPVHKSPSSHLPRIGVTLGDPSGIGPEIVARALCALPKEKHSRVVIFGDEIILEEAYELVKSRPTSKISTGFEGTLRAEQIVPGAPNEASGRAQVAYLEAAVNAARAGEIAGLATAPISKLAAQAVGFSFPGHTEFLADRLAAPEVAMMFAGPNLKVALATVHEAIHDLPKVLTSERIDLAIRLAADSLCKDFGMVCPLIGVLGLNPHAGEGGHFGDEEARVIEPAIRSAQATLGQKAEIVGPLVPDAAFRMELDCYVAMYHDQGLIPVKLIDFDDSVNMTLGLSIVRTSPDHGVAYDIAGKGTARPTSMIAAIDLAFRLIDQRSAN
jgi:4-hydroxythreonine-4-phosphate dehydrogenase